MLTITDSSQKYPEQLRRLHAAPKQLYIDCTEWTTLLQMPMLAVVGTRKPTPYAATMCAQIVREVATKGVCIVSGLALGIDSIAHKAALEVGGKTIAVLPSGLDNIYPASHRQLAIAIIRQGGALLSEYTPKTTASYKGNFIQRNRIIAGLSQVIFIPEAAIKSGSLHTAQFAIEGGIDVCAMPGQITNPLAEGCHNLIKSGAAPITSAADVLQLLNLPSSEAPPTITAASAEERAILELIASGMHDADDLLEASEMQAHKFNQTLTLLEISGKITPSGGNTWYLT